MFCEKSRRNLFFASIFVLLHRMGVCLTSDFSCYNLLFDSSGTMQWPSVNSKCCLFLYYCVRVLNRIQMTSSFLLLLLPFFLPNESSISGQTTYEHCSFHIDSIQTVADWEDSERFVHLPRHSSLMISHWSETSVGRKSDLFSSDLGPVPKLSSRHGTELRTKI